MYFRIFCPKQGQGFKPSAAHPYPNIGQVTPPPGYHGESISGKLPNFEITIVWYAEFQDSACRMLKFQDFT